MVKNKVLKAMLVLGLAALSINVNAFAKVDSIPKTMKPGTVIKYDEEKNMNIIDSGIDSNKVVFNDNIEMNLPEIEAGMTVSYDGTGVPTKITDKDNNIVEFDVIDNKKGSFRGYDPDEPGTNWRHTGYITWYTDRVGQRDHVLGNYDCATRIGHEEPACGTTITVRKNGARSNVYLYKWDIGTLPNAVLDIRPYAFTNLFHCNLDDGHFYGKYGW